MGRKKNELNKGNDNTKDVLKAIYISPDNAAMKDITALHRYAVANNIIKEEDVTVRTIQAWAKQENWHLLKGTISENAAADIITIYNNVSDTLRFTSNQVSEVAVRMEYVSKQITELENQIKFTNAKQALEILEEKKNNLIQEKNKLTEELGVLSGLVQKQSNTLSNFVMGNGVPIQTFLGLAAQMMEFVTAYAIHNVEDIGDAETFKKLLFKYCDIMIRHNTKK